jgi:2-polyprenyl-3-methyl-5-hydroxy-6-metoxy-1,4-benzoquinol methylase
MPGVDDRLGNRAVSDITVTDHDYLLPVHWIVHERDPDGLSTRLHDYCVQRVVRIIRSAGAKTVLEVGCGDGWACGEMVKAGLDVVGIDWRSNALRYAGIRVPGAKFIQADVYGKALVEQFPEKFDAIALIEIIKRIRPADCASALRNILSDLKDGGVLVLTAPSTNCVNDDPQHCRHFTEDALRREISGADPTLTIASIEGYGDVRAEKSYWAAARWFDNRIYRLKPAHDALLQRYHNRTKLGPTSLDRCNGLIMTIRKPAN